MLNKDTKMMSKTLSKYMKDITIPIFKNKLIDIYRKAINNTTLINLNKVKLNKIDLNKVHHKDQYPLIYIFYTRMYNLGLLKGLFEFIPDFTDFWVFVDWYRTHHHLIDINDIHKIVEKSKDQELIDLHAILFRVGGHRKELHNLLYDNQFISLDVLHHTETEDLQLITYTDQLYDIYLYTLKSDENKINDLIDDIFFVIPLMRIIASELNSFHKNKKVKIVIVLGNQKKMIQENDQLCPINVNSGLSVRGEYIYVWRKEEILKVLMHEFVHFYGIDIFGKQGYAGLERKSKEIFQIEGVDYINESYTEINALLIHTLFMEKKLNVTFDKLLAYEIMFSIYQVAKIINFFGGNNADDIYTITFKQTTSVCSYYIIKTLLLLNLNNLFDNSLHDTYIDNIHEIIEMPIKENIKNIINVIIKDINHDNVCLNTMRMTLFGF